MCRLLKQGKEGFLSVGAGSGSAPALSPSVRDLGPHLVRAGGLPGNESRLEARSPTDQSGGAYFTQSL